MEEDMRARKSIWQPRSVYESRFGTNLINMCLIYRMCNMLTICSPSVVQEAHHSWH
jgi:hypothetical protein